MVVIWFQGELMSVWLGMDYVKSTQLWSIALPNAINFAFNYYYVLFFIMASYIPGKFVIYEFESSYSELCGKKIYSQTYLETAQGTEKNVVS